MCLRKRGEFEQEVLGLSIKPDNVHILFFQNLVCINLYLAAPGGSGVRLYDGPDLKLFIFVGWDRSFCLLLGPLN